MNQNLGHWKRFSEDTILYYNRCRPVWYFDGWQSTGFYPTERDFELGWTILYADYGFPYQYDEEESRWCWTQEERDKCGTLIFGGTYNRVTFWTVPEVEGSKNFHQVAAEVAEDLYSFVEDGGTLIVSAKWHPTRQEIFDGYTPEQQHDLFDDDPDSEDLDDVAVTHEYFNMCLEAMGFGLSYGERSEETGQVEAVANWAQCYEMGESEKYTEVVGGEPLFKIGDTTVCAGTKIGKGKYILGGCSLYQNNPTMNKLFEQHFWDYANDRFFKS